MHNKFINDPHDVLREKGYRLESFAYAIGGGEDENDMPIFVKDEFAVYFDNTRKQWRRILYESLNYRYGYPSDYESESIEFDSL